MKNKSIFIILLISLFFGIISELVVFNGDVLFRNNKSNYKIVEYKNMLKTSDGFEITEPNSYIILSTREDYTKKLQFDYKAEENFSFMIIYDNGDEIIQNSSKIINKLSRNIKTKSKKLKIKFDNNNKKLIVSNFTVNNKIFFSVERFFIVCVSLFVLLMLIVERKFFLKNLDKAFLIIAVPLGLAMLIGTPKFISLSWDDAIHYKNINQMFSFKNTKMSNAVRKIMDTDRNHIFMFYNTLEEKSLYYKYLNNIDKNTENTIVQSNNFGTFFNRIIYLPFFIGILIGRLFNFNIVDIFVLSKLINFFVYIFIMYKAIQLAKFEKRYVFMVGLLLSSIFLATSYSYDPLIISFLALAIVLYLRISEEKDLNYKYIFLFILSIVLGTLHKVVYAPMLLLLLFIPTKKFNCKKNAYLFKTLIVILFIVFAFSYILPALNGAIMGDYRGGNTSVSGQIKYILNNPIYGIKSITKYIIYQIPYHFFGTFSYLSSGYTGFKDLSIITTLTILYMIYNFYLIFTNKANSNELSKNTKILFFIMIFGIVLLIILSMFLTFTEVGSPYIVGIQSRYFIPLFLPLYVLFTSISEKKVKCNENIIVILFPAIIMILYLGYMIMNFNL